MELTSQQQAGLETVLTQFKAGKKYAVIAGFAGTGKSTLVQHIIAALQVNEKDVVYCAYTGKATLVLSRKGCKNTSTLHKLLYNARLNTRTGKFSFFPRISFEYPYRVVVVDEVSMVSEEMWKLLQRHRCFVLALGDPGQLGPIKATDDSGLLKDPDVFLDEIIRQAEGNEIIKLSMDIRMGQPLSNFSGDHVKILNKSELSTGMLDWADQILCAKNDTRYSLNRQVRAMHGRGDEPEVGDKIICLRNYWEDVSEVNEDPLVNGTLGWITKVDKYYSHALRMDVLDLSFRTEVDDDFHNLIVDYGLLVHGVSSLTKDDFVRLMRNESTRSMIPREFSYGYAITAWKAQGSEWDNVLLFEESFPWKVEDHKRYLYTGVTRASEKIVVVKK